MAANKVITSNIFMDNIYDKLNFKKSNLIRNISHKRSIRKFRKFIINSSPSFSLLWDMANFIKAAEEVFFYNNSTKNEDIGLFSSKGYIPGQNGFKINHPDCFIIVKLFSDTNKVCVEIERKNGSGLKSLLSFANEQWESEYSIYNEMLLEQVVKIINQKIVDLFDLCYNLR